MYRAQIENIGGSEYYATTKDYSFVLDTEGRGANPVDAMLASLCGCIGHYVRNYLREQQIDYRFFTVESKAALAADNSKLSDIDMWIDLKDVVLDKSRGSELLAYVERCKVYCTLKGNCHITLFLGRDGGKDIRPLEKVALG